MISFRYHVVSLVAVLVALAVGVALGGGPLSEIGRGADSSSAAKKDNQRLAGDLEQARLVSGFQDQFGASVAAAQVKKSLEGRSVAVVTLAGADAKTVTAVTDQVTKAGGSVTGTYAAGKGLLDVENTSLVDTLGAQLLESVKDSGVDAAATTYVRMGQLISRATGTDADAGSALDQGSRDILAGLDGASLLSTTSGGNKRASLVLVVLGDDLTGDGVDKILTGLVSGIGHGTDGAVVVADTESEGLSAIRDDPATAAAVSTVDSVQTRSGQLASVLALAAEATGGPGHYGAHGKDGAIPRG